MKQGRVLMLGYLILENDPRVLREAQSLRTAGWDVEVLTLKKEKKARCFDREDGIKVRELNASKYRGGSTIQYLWSYFVFGWLAFWATWSRSLKQPYDSVHVHTIPDLMVMCGWPATWFGSTLVLDVHDTVPELYQDKFECGPKHPLIRLLRWTEIWAVNQADKVIAVNYEHGELVGSRGGREGDLTIVFNAVDQDLFRPRESDRDGPVRKLLMHGTQAHRHGADLLLRAMPAVLEAEPDVTLRICGSGDAVPGMIELQKELGLEEAVEITGIYHPLEEMAEFVRESDLGVIPYRRSESTQYMLPTKLMEYLSAGLAVVTAETVPVRSMFEGLAIWESEDPQELADLLIEQIREPQRIELPEELCWDRHQHVLQDLYKQILIERLPGHQQSISLTESLP